MRRLGMSSPTYKVKMWFCPRFDYAVTLRMAGYTYREIGEKVGSFRDSAIPVCTERARQLVCKGARHLAQPESRDHPCHEWSVALLAVPA